MSPTTKAQALEKLHAIVNKIGYPGQVARLQLGRRSSRDDFFGNVERATVFESNRELAKIGKPVDRGEWGMTPPTVNAYYDPQMNDINFPAGVLQPPLYDPKIDDAPNYGNTGATIGHELTHGFDDEGRQFDAHGNLKTGGRKKMRENFTKRAQCVVDQYAQYTIVDDIKINSKLTEGEDVADLGGTDPRLDGVEGPDRRDSSCSTSTDSRPSSASSSASRSGPARTSAPRTCASAPSPTRTRPASIA